MITFVYNPNVMPSWDKEKIGVVLTSCKSCFSPPMRKKRPLFIYTARHSDNLSKRAEEKGNKNVCLPCYVSALSKEGVIENGKRWQGAQKNHSKAEKAS